VNSIHRSVSAQGGLMRLPFFMKRQDETEMFIKQKINTNNINPETHENNQDIDNA